MSSGRHLLVVTAWNLYLASHAHRPFSFLVFVGLPPSKYHFRIHATGAEQGVPSNPSSRGSSTSCGFVFGSWFGMVLGLRLGVDGLSVHLSKHLFPRVRRKRHVCSEICWRSHFHHPSEGDACISESLAANVDDCRSVGAVPPLNGYFITWQAQQLVLIRSNGIGQNSFGRGELHPRFCAFRHSFKRCARNAPETR